MKRDYVPRGLVARAIEILTACAPASMRSAELAEQMQEGLDGKQLRSVLRWAVARGLVHCESDPADKRRLVWSLGSGLPLEVDRDDDASDAAAPGDEAASTPVAPPPSWPFGATGPSVPLGHDESMLLSCALWSNGVLQVRRACGEQLWFTRAEAQVLRDYLAQVQA